jgi:hypothetical protein
VSWEIRIPYRSREDSLAEVGFAARQLDAEERAIVRALVLQAALGGCRTAGDLLDRVGHATVAERRLIYDDAREAAGLERSQDIDDRERFEEARAEALRRGVEPIQGLIGGELKGCAAEGCKALPIDQNGHVVLAACRRWWCPEHGHLAEPGDELPDEDGVAVLDANFRLLPSPREQRRMRETEAHERAERERQAAEKRAETEALRKIKERWGETADPIDIAGYRVRPGGRIVDE